jgi:3'-phosphoadenosine 5'-phosphosulfate sulfotransferase (PAPS reductase)/FAD synthetase
LLLFLGVEPIARFQKIATVYPTKTDTVREIMGIAMNQNELFDLHDDLKIFRLKNVIAQNVIAEKKLKQEIIMQCPADPYTFFNAPDIDMSTYDLHVVAISTGKDCMALLCELLSSGVHPSNIIALHHLVDGDINNDNFFDWHYVDDYFKQLCTRLGIQMAYAYLEGGIKSEILKQNRVSDDIIIIKPDGVKEAFHRPLAKPNTRLKFPQVVADLRTRWCSSILKIEPGNKFLRSMDHEFIGKKVAFHTGERRAESTGRSKYNQLELHAVDTLRRSKKPKINRSVDHIRLVLNYSEEQVWDTLKNFDYIAPSGEHIKGILPAPAYALLGRSSCSMCIFNSDAAFATIHSIRPTAIEEVADYENQFGITIARPKKNQAGKNVLERALSAEPLPYTDKEAVEQCFSEKYTLPLFASEGIREWKIPFGAFGTESCGAI